MFLTKFVYHCYLYMYPSFLSKSFWSCWPISRKFDRASGKLSVFGLSMIHGKRKRSGEMTAMKLNQCLHGGSTSKHKSVGNQSVRLAPLLTEPFHHHSEIHQKHLLELHCKWSMCLGYWAKGFTDSEQIVHTSWSNGQSAPVLLFTYEINDTL